MPPGPPARPRKGQGYAGDGQGGRVGKNLPKGRVRLRTAADVPVSPGLAKPNILFELLNLSIPRILNLLKYRKRRRSLFCLSAGALRRC